ncbi:hypothetical protein PPERSA_05904 [Pseudocohnilembus persalinus]|uniref:Transmembrane protein n=1 Tax=Pseudocohnilembus persalinus TaxID=266149 RepID=A0A0V0R424_PSEPJ|nr:hypothetical protein PPERSA_05904 [Pseudocohnilembus persalinus]|eukprot:KRX09235.1 hypothetical protein PPERSA_05904 [Pseudocohnilembus persalinus]
MKYKMKKTNKFSYYLFKEQLILKIDIVDNWLFQEGMQMQMKMIFKQQLGKQMKKQVEIYNFKQKIELKNKKQNILFFQAQIFNPKIALIFISFTWEKLQANFMQEQIKMDSNYL